MVWSGSRSQFLRDEMDFEILIQASFNERVPKMITKLTNHRNQIYIERPLKLKHILASKKQLYNQVQKVVLHRHMIYFTKGLCGLIIFGDF
jgi:hypothetical protein